VVVRFYKGRLDHLNVPKPVSGSANKTIWKAPTRRRECNIYGSGSLKSVLSDTQLIPRKSALKNGLNDRYTTVSESRLREPAELGKYSLSPVRSENLERGCQVTPRRVEFLVNRNFNFNQDLK
jgi:hypothetical protein